MLSKSLHTLLSPLREPLVRRTAAAPPAACLLSGCLPQQGLGALLSQLAAVQVDVTALDGHIFVMAFNDATDSRSYLTLAASCNGHTWQRVVLLEDDPAGSFSYPTLQDLPAEVSRGSSFTAELVSRTALTHAGCAGQAAGHLLRGLPA